MAKKVEINRAPVLTLWAAVVAERLGHSRATALTLGRALAGLNAQTKGRRLGIFGPLEGDEAKAKEEKRKKVKVEAVELMGREIPTVRTRGGVRAAIEGKPMEPESVERYLASKFGEHLDDVRKEMKDLAGSYPPSELAGQAFSLYEKFRPSVPRGEKGWGAKGELDLAVIRKLAK
jgi:hypothetical protein